jgi:hypothetical protein
MESAEKHPEIEDGRKLRQSHDRISGLDRPLITALLGHEARLIEIIQDQKSLVDQLEGLLDAWTQSAALVIRRFEQALLTKDIREQCEEMRTRVPRQKRRAG